MLSRRRRAVALLAALLLAFAGQASALVLCVGANGHVSLESTSSDCCLDEAKNSSNQDRPQGLFAEDCSDPCVDSLVACEATSERPGASAPRLERSTACVVLTPWGLFREASLRGAPLALRQPPPLAPPASRQTILLC